jgi:hypothetical protein
MNKLRIIILIGAASPLVFADQEHRDGDGLWICAYALDRKRLAVDRSRTLRVLDIANNHLSETELAKVQAAYPNATTRMRRVLLRAGAVGTSAYARPLEQAHELWHS